MTTLGMVLLLVLAARGVDERGEVEGELLVPKIDGWVVDGCAKDTGGLGKWWSGFRNAGRSLGDVLLGEDGVGAGAEAA